MDFQERIPGNDYARQLYLTATPDGLDVTVDDSETELTITLGQYGIRELRLAIARYERYLAKAKATADGRP